VNAQSRLVGFDIEMAHRLARELRARPEFVRVARERLAGHLSGGTCDVAMSGLAVTTDRARRVALSVPYLDTTLAFLVLDHRRQEFSSWARLRTTEGLRIASPPVAYYAALLRERLPKAEIVEVDSVRSFLREPSDFDALMYSAEAGSAWTLVYPDFSVVVPEPGRVEIPLAYATARGESARASFLDTWINLKRKDGTIDALFQHWILGRSAASRQPRWSVLHDVLRWGEAEPEASGE
jgi:ABC-type amino acid transport substrate-binding protein